MAGLPSRVFLSKVELEGTLEAAAKLALVNTLKHFKKEFRKIAVSHIYKNAYTPKWYERTHWLEDEDALEYYIYKNSKNFIGGGVRFNRKAYDNYTEGFQHGNAVRYLPMNSYLEIMNNGSLLPTGDKNIFHFPTGSQINRGHFYEECLDLLDKEFDTIFDQKWEDAKHYVQTGKPFVHSNGNGDSSSPSSNALSSSTKHIPSYSSNQLNID